MTAAIDYRICLCRNGYVRGDRTRQVVIEMRQLGVRRTLSTHVHVFPADFAFGRVQPSNPDHDLLNRRLRRMVRRLMELEDEMIEAGQEPTPDSLLRAYAGHQTQAATIAEWVETVIAPSDRRARTKELYQCLLNVLDSFQLGLRLSDISHDMLVRLQHWMSTKRKLAPSTVSCRMKTLRCLVSEAVKRGVIRADDDPFRNFRIPEIKARREHLTEQQLATLETLDLDDSPRLSHIRDAFLFCCYTGLRWSDFSRLSSSFLVTVPSVSSAPPPLLLSFSQQKTGHPVRIPLDTIFNGRPAAILRRYGSPESLAAIGSNKEANSDLRLVAQRAGITIHLHWHLARHTCGTLLNQHGLRMQEIQFILGHQKQETTERHYAETVLEQVQHSLQQAFPPSPVPK